MDITQTAQTRRLQVSQFPYHLYEREQPPSRDTSQLCTLGPRLLRL